MPFTVDQPAMTRGLTVSSILLRTAERHPAGEALVDRDQRFTYAEWNARVNRVAHALSALGVRPHDRVALLLEAGEAAVTLYMATQKLGAIAVPCNTRLSAGEVAHILGDSGARVLAYAGSLRDVVLRAASDVRAVCELIVVEPGDAPISAGQIVWESLTASGPDHEPVISNAVAPEVLSALVYTSGTTGRAKGVMHTHANDVAIAITCALEYQLGPDDRALHVAPLYHVGGMQAFFLPHLLVGATNVIEPRASATATLRAIERERATTLFAVPAQIQQLLTDPCFGAHDVGSLKMITTGGATLPEAVIERVLAGLCPRLFNGYGLTEASLSLLLRPRDALRKLGSCGKPTLLADARIVAHDPDRDVLPSETVSVGEVGELVVRGPHCTPGYWNRPTESAKRIRHGWLYTGDLFTRDSDGYYHFQGRADYMIVSGGENIYPLEVEAVLQRCPGVRDAAVAGLPDDRWGHAVAAFVVRDNPALDAQAINDHCLKSDMLARYKRPRRIIFVDELPRNASGKVLLRDLVERHT